MSDAGSLNIHLVIIQNFISIKFDKDVHEKIKSDDAVIILLSGYCSYYYTFIPLWIPAQLSLEQSVCVVYIIVLHLLTSQSYILNN